MTNNLETADRLTRRRARTWLVLAFLFIAQQSTYFSDSVGPSVAHFKIGAWLLLTILLLLALATGGALFRSKAVRALMNDETMRAHRAQALILAFWTTMATGVLLYVLSVFHAFDPRNAIHMMMTVGIASALFRFAMLERQALA